MCSQAPFVSDPAGRAVQLQYLPLVCAVPVASPQAVEKVRAYADEVVCPLVTADFYAVGQFYRRFDQVDDAEVVELLRGEGEAATRGAR